MEKAQYYEVDHFSAHLYIQENTNVSELNHKTLDRNRQEQQRWENSDWDVPLQLLKNLLEETLQPSGPGLKSFRILFHVQKWKSTCIIDALFAVLS